MVLGSVPHTRGIEADKLLSSALFDLCGILH
jgi:hypothetical protein